MSTLDISIIIATYNRAEMLRNIGEFHRRQVALQERLAEQEERGSA